MDSLKPVKVLLVDDDEDDYILTREIFSEIPQREHYKLSWINNYEEGINAMLKSHYDIYLVDYRLGKYTGLDLLHEAIRSNVDEPIIILTGKGDSKVDEEALHIGAADYLVKDQIDPYTIERSIRYALKHKRTLKALKESENKFRIIFERSKEPFIILESNGSIRDINGAGVKFLSYDKEEIFLLKGGQFFYNKDDSNRFSREMDEKGAINDFDTDFITKTGEIKKVSISAFLQIDQHATEELYYCIIHDLTGRKKTEKASVNVEKIGVTERIAKSLANEITNPLSNINLSLEQLKLELPPNDETINLYLDILHTNFERINVLISNFINSTQSLDLEIKPHSLNTLIEESIASYDESNDNDIIINKHFQDEEIIVNVDANQILNVLTNILINSKDALSSEININLFIEINYAVIQITDNGIGIPDNNQSKIFEPFFTTKQKRIGLGLTNAIKSIINHKGTIDFESEENIGTKFIIKLPIQAQASFD